MFVPVRACVCVSCAKKPPKNNRTLASAHVEGKALGPLRRYLFFFFFFNLVILITVHIYLHFLFVSALDSHL